MKVSPKRICEIDKKFYIKNGKAVSIAKLLLIFILSWRIKRNSLNPKNVEVTDPVIEWRRKQLSTLRVRPIRGGWLDIAVTSKFLFKHKSPLACKHLALTSLCFLFCIVMYFIGFNGNMSITCLIISKHNLSWMIDYSFTYY